MHNPHDSDSELIVFSLYPSLCLHFEMHQNRHTSYLDRKAGSSRNYVFFLLILYFSDLRSCFQYIKCIHVDSNVTATSNVAAKLIV